jgi:hypothetical protein
VDGGVVLVEYAARNAVTNCEEIAVRGLGVLKHLLRDFAKQIRQADTFERSTEPEVSRNTAPCRVASIR